MNLSITAAADVDAALKLNQLECKRYFVGRMMAQGCKIEKLEEVASDFAYMAQMSGERPLFAQNRYNAVVRVGIQGDNLEYVNAVMAVFNERLMKGIKEERPKKIKLKYDADAERRDMIGKIEKKFQEIEDPSCNIRAVRFGITCLDRWIHSLPESDEKRELLERFDRCDAKPDHYLVGEK